MNDKSHSPAVEAADLQDFEQWIEEVAGPGALTKWPNTSGTAYENTRVQDYRTGWCAHRARAALTSQQEVAAPVGDAELQAALKLIGGPLQVSGQRGLRHIETGAEHPLMAGAHIASGKNEALLDAICTVVNAASRVPVASVAVGEPLKTFTEDDYFSLQRAHRMLRHIAENSFPAKDHDLDGGTRSGTIRDAVLFAKNALKGYEAALCHISDGMFATPVPGGAGGDVGAGRGVFTPAMLHPMTADERAKLNTTLSDLFDRDRATPAASPAVGEVVTPAMIDAGAKAAREYFERTGGNSPGVIYRAMRAAAPQGAAPAVVQPTPGQADQVSVVGVTDAAAKEARQPWAPAMNIHGPRGRKVVYTGENGYPNEHVYAVKAGLVVGAEYVIERCDIHSSSTSVFLAGIKGGWNSVIFADVKDWNEYIAAILCTASPAGEGDKA